MIWVQILVLPYLNYATLNNLLDPPERLVYFSFTFYLEL